MSIQIVEIAQPSVIDTVAVAQPSTVAVVEVRQGPAGVGGGGSATWGSITGTLSSQTDLQTALNLKAPLASPALTGTPTAPTAATTTNTTQLATTAFVQQELASGVAVAKNLEFLARNETGVTITKGSVVYVSGATGNKPLITLAQANNDANSAQTIGFAKEDIAHNGTGFVIVRGELENVKTFGATEGQQLYLSPTTAGSFTTTKPSAPDHLVYVGIVIAASTGSAFNGTILVTIQNGYELNELHDVAAQSPSAGQFLKRNAGNTLWINSAIVSADISDATSAATANRIVVRDGSGSASLEYPTFGSGFQITEAGGTDTFGMRSAAADTWSMYGPDYGDVMSFSKAGVINFSPSNFSYATGAASAHRTALGAGATGDQLFTAASVKAANETLLRTTKIKTTQTDRNNTTTGTTYTTDSDFTHPVTAGKTYRVEFAIYTTATNTGTGGGGFKGQFIIPSVPANLTGATSQGVGITTTPGGTLVNLAMTTGGVIGTTALSRTSASTNGTYHGFFEVTIGTTGGNLLFQWAQSASSVDNTSVLANSTVTVIERTP